MAGIICGGRRTHKLNISSFIRFTTRATTAPKLFCSKAPCKYEPFKYSTTLPPSLSPWLRLPNDNILNLVDKTLVDLDMICTDSFYVYRDMFNKRVCIGSSRGSLSYVFDNHDVFIFSPYCGGIIANFHYQCELSGPFSTRCYTRVDDVHTFLSEPWQPTLDCSTPINYREFHVHRPKHSNFEHLNFDWTEYPYLFHKDDPPIVYSAATKTVYKLSMDSEHHFHIELWDVFQYPIKVKSRFHVATSFTTMEASERELRARCHQDKYLVVTEDYSGEGESGLYLVVRHHNREEGVPVSETRAMDVFKFDLADRKMTQTTELDNHAFFIGRGSDPFAVKVDTCPELKTDSIYISDDLHVFDLKDSSLTPFVDMGDLSITRPHTFWVSPLPPSK